MNHPRSSMLIKGCRPGEGGKPRLPGSHSFWDPGPGAAPSRSGQRSLLDAEGFRGVNGGFVRHVVQTSCQPSRGDMSVRFPEGMLRRRDLSEVAKVTHAAKLGPCPAGLPEALPAGFPALSPAVSDEGS